MPTVQIPPNGVPATFTVEVPPPDGLDSVAGVRIESSWSGGRSVYFTPRLDVGGERQSVYGAGTTPTGRAWIAIFPSQPVPATVQLTVTFTGASPEPGSTVTLTVQGAQTQTGEPPLNPDAGGAETFYGPVVEAGTVEILSWEEWNDLNAGS